ncbi:VPS45 [Lepeophtheirus salmonis]|uniref:VPS45 n=1 Tax=Lepeophtheirus salmonis TaxID=72036 RepID=A0A7R8HB62_LEPSM|nr:VPS45 [Lepeophtheirus salmonis]CAF2981341.1 VPS45 [Lepeophtheirus salmonis]
MTLNLPDLIRQSLFDELDAIKGMKTLIMDSVTMGIIDLACSKSLIMKKEVFLFEDVTKFRQGRKRYKDPKLSHLKAIVVIRNVNENIEALIYELSNNSYNSYHLFFTNRIDSMTIKRLAEADMNEVGVTKFNYKSADIKRFSEGLSAATKLLRMTSSSILYQSTSLETDRIAHSLSSSLESSNGFSDEGVILILDRRFDPITPLVFNWTYFNLIHELLGFNNNKVTFTDSSSKTTQTSFSTDGDEFYKQNIYADYGKFCSSIKRLVDDFQKRRNEHDNMDSLGDIKDFISRYPEFKKLSGIVDKHVSIVDEIAKKVQMRDLLNISLLEQEILVSSNQSSIVNKLKRDLFPPPSQAENTNIQRSDLFRMLLITALKLKDISFLSQIQASDVNTADISCINEYIGRNFELFQKDNRIYPVSSNIINEF